MTEPIYEVAPGGFIALVSDGSPVLGLYRFSDAGVRQLCAWLNENPLPEDKPKRFFVDSPFRFNAHVVRDRQDRGVIVADYTASHPDPKAAAQAECERLNTDV